MIWEFGIVVRVAPSWATEQRKLKEMHLGEKRKKKEKKEKTRNFALEKRTNKEGRRKGRETPSSPYVVALKEHSGLGMENIIFKNITLVLPFECACS